MNLYEVNFFRPTLYYKEFHAFFVSFVLEVLKDVLKVRGKGLKKLTLVFQV
jgi:hypothetical protein